MSTFRSCLSGKAARRYARARCISSRAPRRIYICKYINVIYLLFTNKLFTAARHIYFTRLPGNSTNIASSLYAPSQSRFSLPRSLFSCFILAHTLTHASITARNAIIRGIEEQTGPLARAAEDTRKTVYVCVRAREHGMMHTLLVAAASSLSRLARHRAQGRTIDTRDILFSRRSRITHIYIYKANIYRRGGIIIFASPAKWFILGTVSSERSETRVRFQYISLLVYTTESI